MKETHYICNRCNKEIPTYRECMVLVFLDLADGEISATSEAANVTENNIHFCTKCAGKVMKEILNPADGGAKAIQGEQDKTPKVPKEVAQRKGKPKRSGSRLDGGKVMALHRAGWDNKKIADEMGVSEKQIYHCIWYQTKKSGLKCNLEEQTEEER